MEEVREPSDHAFLGLLLSSFSPRSPPFGVDTCGERTIEAVPAVLKECLVGELSTYLFFNNLTKPLVTDQSPKAAKAAPARATRVVSLISRKVVFPSLISM